MERALEILRKDAEALGLKGDQVDRIRRGYEQLRVQVGWDKLSIEEKAKFLVSAAKAYEADERLEATKRKCEQADREAFDRMVRTEQQLETERRREHSEPLVDSTAVAVPKDNSPLSLARYALCLISASRLHSADRGQLASAVRPWLRHAEELQTLRSMGAGRKGIKPGDIVRLKSGSPPMTVGEVILSAAAEVQSTALCYWSRKWRWFSVEFPLTVLKLETENGADDGT